MADPFLGEILAVAFNFVPQGWLACDGKLYLIAEHQALFSLLGTAYGGDGQSTFAVPDLRGRLQVNQGTNPQGRTYALGETGGTEQVTLTTANMPPHNHAFNASSQLGGYWPPSPYPPPKPPIHAPGPGMALGVNTQTSVNLYGADPAPVTLSATSISLQGQSMPLENRQPFLAINYIIAAVGIFPTKS
jgi:microcystin-dependent protein